MTLFIDRVAIVPSIHDRARRTRDLYHASDCLIEELSIMGYDRISSLPCVLEVFL
jgi:hypothetical protein